MRALIIPLRSDLDTASARNNGKCEKRARYGKDELFAASLLILCDKSRPMQSRQTTSPTSEVNGCQRFIVQSSAKRWFQGLVNFVSARAYHFCLALPAEFTQPGNHLLAELCTSIPLDFGLSGGEKRLRQRWWHQRTTVKRQVAPAQFRAARRLHLEGMQRYIRLWFTHTRPIYTPPYITDVG